MKNILFDYKQICIVMLQYGLFIIIKQNVIIN